LDVKANLYMAVRSLKRPGIRVADPAGKELAYIATGEPQTNARQAVSIPANSASVRKAARSM